MYETNDSVSETPLIENTALFTSYNMVVLQVLIF